MPGQERITIVEDVPLPRGGDHVHSPTTSSTNKRRYPWIGRIKDSRLYHWIHKQVMNQDNRYAFQMAVAFSMAALLVIIDPLSNILPNVFWVGKIVKADIFFLQ